MNRWLFFAAYMVVFGITMFSFSKEVRERLYDRSHWTKEQRTLSAIGKLFSFANIILFILSPLRIKTTNFYIGLILWLLGLVGMVTALLNYSNTPINVTVTSGI